MKQIGSEALREWIAAGKEFSLVDVREPEEHAAFNIGGTLVPLGEIMGAQAAFVSNMPVVVYCEKGIRSVIAIQRLEQTGLKNLYNLNGGMWAWRKGLGSGLPASGKGVM